MFVITKRKVAREELVRLSAQLIAEFGEGRFEVGKDGLVVFEDSAYVYDLQLAHAHAMGFLRPDGQAIQRSDYAVVAEPGGTLVHVRLAWIDLSSRYRPRDATEFMDRLAERLEEEFPRGSVEFGWVNWQSDTGWAHAYNEF